MPTLVILHSDDQVIAVDKPAGVLTIPGRTSGVPDLHARAETELGARLWVVHRLDRDTSGVVLFARTAAAHRALNLAFDRREVRKGYLALCRGSPPQDQGVVELALRAGRKGRTVVAAEGGKASLTRWRVVERLGAFTLIEALPETGRSHQIRVHLAAVGLPLVVDPLYARVDREGRLERTPLHAAWIDVPHPAGGRLRVESPLPEDMRAAIAAARPP